MKGLQLGILAALIGANLTGCGNDTLDWDNARISGGKVYAGNANVPFSGHITNAPQRFVITDPEAELLRMHFQNVEPANRQEAMYTQALTCDLNSKDGLRDDKIACRTKTGLVRLEGGFDGGAPKGKWTIYDTEGGVSLSTAFDNSKLDGRLDIYNPNGQGKLLSQGYKKGLLDGSFQRWLGNGTLVLSSEWANGKQNGLYREWWDSGKSKMQMTYKDGKQEGLITVYDQNGKITRTIAPYQGEYARVTYFGPNGEATLYDVDTIGVYQPVASSIVPSNLKAASTTSCYDQWVNAYRQEVGEEAMVKHDQIEEWEQWCKEGKMPGS